MARPSYNTKTMAVSMKLRNTSTLIGFLIRRRKQIQLCLLLITIFWLSSRIFNSLSRNRQVFVSDAHETGKLDEPQSIDNANPFYSEKLDEIIDEADLNEAPRKVKRTLWSPTSRAREIDDGRCVPKQLRHLATNYTARLCRQTKWTGNWSKETAELTCQYPSINPFDRVIARHFKKDKKVACGRPKLVPRLFTTDLDYLVTLEDPVAHGYSNCCYSNIIRRAHSDAFPISFKHCNRIVSTRQKIPSRLEFIKIYCYPHAKSDRPEPYVEYLAFVPMKAKKTARNPPAESVNVAILGIDAVSRMNLIRTMPKTYEYINEDLEGHGLFGFNKVGDNTFANIIPLLTGMSADQISATPRIGCPIWMGPYDKCPFLWKTFADHGYRTIYAEDWTHLTMFNYMKRGFATAPTTYYLRPMISHSDFHFNRNHDENCFAGPKLHFQYLLDYMKAVAVRMGSENRYFSFMWENSLTHHKVALAKEGDEPLFQTLKWFKQSGYLNNTVLIIMSDHGMRYLGFRDTLQGRFEDRMPFLFFVFPTWFSAKYPKAMENLRRNKHKLTTVYDVHQTLKDLLRLANIKDDRILRRTKAVDKLDVHNAHLRWFLRRYGHSLFLPLPKTRLCPEAGVPPLYCICHQFEAKSTKDFFVRRAARFIIQEINQRIKNYTDCAHLALGRVLSAHNVIIPSRQLKFDKDVAPPKHLKGQSARQYIQQLILGSSVTTLVITASPGDATYEGAVSRLDDGKLSLWGGVSRINMYGNRSNCVARYEIKPFCFCRD